jgi:predicted O-methyltransferase YrrM
MASFESFLTRFPGGDRVYYSGRWLRRLFALWRHPNRRFLTFPPGHYASPLPDHAEIERDLPALLAAKDVPGIDLRTAAQLELLQTLAVFAAESPFPTHATPGFRYHFENDFFTYGDAIYLYGLLRHLQPQRIIEVGSGYSSAVMLDTRDRHGLTAELTFIEPHPTRLNALLISTDRNSSKLIDKLVQDVPMELFTQLEANDILFIDSSHVGKIGSDVNRLLFEVLPRLRPGVVIHIHDIFWPFEYPKLWYDRGWAWNEAYLVRAMLQGGRYEVLLFPSYLESQHTETVTRLMPTAMKRAANTAATGASSLWLRVRG